jgi:hypothetical protein
VSLQINTANASLSYDRSKMLLTQVLGLKNGINDNLLVQHTIRSEVALNTTATSFHLPILTNDQQNGTNTYLTENRLTLQDLFVVNQIGFFVASPSSPIDTAFKLSTYGDPQIFTTAGAAAAINGMYANAYLKYTNNNRVVLPYWDLQRHYNSPVQQSFDKPYYSASNTQAYGASQNGSVDGFYPVEPSIIFNGGGNIDMNVILKGNLAAIQANSRIVCLFRGILLQNASSVK